MDEAEEDEEAEAADVVDEEIMDVGDMATNINPHHHNSSSCPPPVAMVEVSHPRRDYEAINNIKHAPTRQIQLNILTTGTCAATADMTSQFGIPAKRARTTKTTLITMTVSTVLIQSSTKRQGGE